MKRFFTLVFLLCAGYIQAQTDGLTYQAVIIDPNPQEVPGNDISGNVLSEGQVWLRFSILKSGEIEYQELHETTTDANGLINLVIGLGESTGLGTLAWDAIDWDGSARQLGVELAFSEGNYEDFGSEELHFVPYAYHRNITASGTLQVSLDAQFDSDASIDGNVLVEGNSVLEGTLNVGGATVIENTASIADDTDIGGDLEVDGRLDVGGNTQLDGFLDVTNDTDLGGELEVEGSAWITGSNTVFGSQTVHQDAYFADIVTIYADVNGSDDDWDHYPLHVNGSNQGIAVRLDGSTDESKNYMLFQSNSGINQGRIEGQTPWQLSSSWRYIFDIAAMSVQSGLAFAEAAACAVNVPPDAGEILTNNILGGTIAAQAVEYIFNYNLNIGVTYLSGSADYAEYLPRMDADAVFYPGQVVGVFAGQISHETEGADHLLVISTNPAVLGNMPPEAEKHLNEMVAFLGQVPVRVAGPVHEGDYIVASGNNDGFARAVNPRDLPTDQFDQIIGVSWETASNAVANTVNVAIGLHANVLADRVASLEARLDRLEASLNGDTPPAVEPKHVQTPAHPVDLDAAVAPYLQPSGIDPQTLEVWLEEVSPYIEQEMAKARTHLQALGSAYDQYPELALLIDEPTEALRQMHQGTLLPSMWESLKKASGR